MKRIILIALASAVLLSGTACGRATLDEELAERVGQVAEGGVGSTVDPEALTDFEWESLWVFGSYVSGDEIEQTIGFSWGGAEHAAPLTEGKCVFVFVLDDEVVRWARVPGDFRPLIRDEPWRPGDVFVVQDATDAWGPHTVVVPVDAASP